jgi:hypothetical protein
MRLGERQWIEGLFGMREVIVPCALAALALTACATSTTTTPKGTNPELIAHCRNLMYIARVPRGPPNWNLYEQCLRGMPGTW